MGRAAGGILSACKMAMRCARCGNAINSGIRCSCGYNFLSGTTLFSSQIPIPQLSQIRAAVEATKKAEIPPPTSPVYTGELEKLRVEAIRGSVSSQLTLGQQLLKLKEPEEAAKWFLMAGNKGDAEAQYEMGNLFRTGRGVNKSYTEAVRWYQLSASQGNTGALFSLGMIYEGDWAYLRTYLKQCDYTNLLRRAGCVSHPGR